MESRTIAPAKGQVTALLVVALVLGAGGFGLGAYSLISGGQGPQGDQGNQGPTGIQGPAGMPGPVVGITQPGNNTIIYGIVTVRIMLWNSTPCTFKVLVNRSINATALPWVWNTNASQFGNGWWNLTVQAINGSGYVAQDQVLVFIDNCASHWSASDAADDSFSSADGVWNNITGVNINITIARPKQVQFTFTALTSYNGYNYLYIRFIQNGTQIGFTGIRTGDPNIWDFITLQHVQLFDPGSYEIKIQGSGVGGTPGAIHFTQYKVLTINAFDP